MVRGNNDENPFLVDFELMVPSVSSQGVLQYWATCLCQLLLTLKRMIKQFNVIQSVLKLFSFHSFAK